MNILKFDIEAGNFSKGGEASSQLKSTLRKLGIPAQIIRKTAIVTYELEMNIIIHSLGGKLKSDIDPQRIKILASDCGPGIEDLDKAFQPGYSTAEDSVRKLGFGAGMGLCNIKRYADDLNVTSEVDKGTEIEALIYLK